MSKYFRRIQCCLLAVFALLLPTKSFSEDGDFPPFWSIQRNNPVTGNPYYLRYLGPLGEKLVSPEEQQKTLWAFRPFWSSFENRAEDVSGSDYLWPVSVWRNSWFADFRWILLYFGHEEKDSRKDYVYPIWFSGIKNNEFWWALFPIYGETHDFFLYDQMKFVLFPIYLQTLNEGTYGESYLWPIVNWDKGPKMEKFRIFPFYAQRTIYEKEWNQSILWPLFHRKKSLEEGRPGEGWFLLPLIGKNTLRDDTAWTFLWPLFYYGHSPRSLKINAPWPIFRYWKDERHGRDLLHFWPIWGRHVTNEYDLRFYLWPIIQHQKDWSDRMMTEGLWILPLYWSRSEYEIGLNPKRISHYRRFWPFVSLYEKGDYFSITALDASPIRNFPVVDRNLSPLWRLYTYEGNRTGSTWDFLWGTLKAYDLREKDKYFAWSPFYEVNYNIMDKVLLETNEANPDIGITPFQRIEYDTERSFLFGMVKVSTSVVYPTRWKLFWCLDFEI